jgi:hypothetical protein
MKGKLWVKVIVLFLSGYVLLGPLKVTPPSYLHGVAMAYPSSSDFLNLNATWYHDWGPCSDAECVPMTVTGADPGLSSKYNKPILFLNEPDGGPPTSVTTSVSTGVEDYTSLVAKYPYAKWVVGNIVSMQSNWLIQFHNTCRCSPYAWGAHAYFSDSTELEQVESWLINLHMSTGGNYWISEWADISGNVANDQAFYSWMKSQPWIQRAAYFTNRVEGIESWYPHGWNVPLINWSRGTLTNIGMWFSGVR